MKLAIFGYGGHAREVASYIDDHITFFVDDQYAIEFLQPLSSFNPLEYKMMVAVGDSTNRNKIISYLPKETKFVTYIHPTALIGQDVEIGEGSYVGPYSILTTNIKIGKHAIINRGNQIGHDCIIGDYFSMMPGAIVSGNVSIGNKVYIGTNASIISKKFICSDVTIGAGATIVKNINLSGTYVGVPAKKIK
jgi:sugar O-acyltransferase (sialic acid O-acetyltransferase NeuD family)